MHSRSENGTEISLVEAVDLFDIAEVVLEYARTYLSLLEAFYTEVYGTEEISSRRALLKRNAHITSIDTIHFRMDDLEDLYVIAPTHPLKLLWSLQLARATRLWIDALSLFKDKRPEWSEIYEFISRSNSVNLPNTLMTDKGNVILNIENLDILWSIFAEESLKDPRSLISEFRMRIGGPENINKISSISYRDILEKFNRYLQQHPYVETLVVNAIKPGSASILVNVLLELEKSHPEMNYKINLFSDGPRDHILGHAFDDLMMLATSSRGKEELDPFLMASKEPLYPKLVYSKNSLSEYMDHPDYHDGHITIMFDAFSATVGKDIPKEEIRSNFVYGLVEQYHDMFINMEDRTYWIRQMNLSDGKDVPDDMVGLSLLVPMANRINNINAYFLDPESKKGSRLGTCLNLGPFDKNLLSLVHQHSDWVMIIDRNFGIEFLDNPFEKESPVYLIDHQPDQFNNIGHRMIISTRQVSEVTKIISPILEDLGLDSDIKEKEALIQALGSISGRLVQKLLMSGNSSRESIGLALTRVFLEQSGSLLDMILVPIDGNLELFEKARSFTNNKSDPLSLQRSDLILIDMDPSTRQITFNIIEVKLRSEGTFAGLTALKDGIKEQLKNTTKALRSSFDPDIDTPDRIDRPIQSLALGNILRYYAERSSRYRILPKENLPFLCSFIDDLESGYSLNIKNFSLIFSTKSDGYDTEIDSDITYFFIGRNKVQDLISAAKKAFITKTNIEPDPNYGSIRATFTKRKANILRMTEKVYPEQKNIPIDSDTAGKNTSSKPKASEIAKEDHKINEESEKITCDIILGGKGISSQFGLLGKAGGRKVGLDINNPNSISIFGVQGSGKSYTLGAIIEMSLMSIKNINKLSHPLAGMVFHYSKTEEYRPEFTSILQPNTGTEVGGLLEKYGAQPQGLKDVLILAPVNKVEKRKKEFSGLSVKPILFDSSELNIEDWKFLMGAIGNNAMYIRAINLIIKRLAARNNLNFESIFSSIVDLNESQMTLAKMRLDFAQQYIKDGERLGELVRPGRLIIVDLRDELTSKDEALGLFMVLQRIFATAGAEDANMNKLIVFDEAHNYMKTDFIDDVVETIRLMRHKGNTIVVASQDPESVPLKLIELSSMVILHKMNSPSWVKHIQKGVTALAELRPSQLNSLQSGQAFIWAAEATDNIFTTRAVKVDIRPRVTEHGGKTVKAGLQ
ncbi:MAG: hypothetical protein WCE68_15755 [Anaerolineales bacterium]